MTLNYSIKGQLWKSFSEYLCLRIWSTYWISELCMVYYCFTYISKTAYSSIYKIIFVIYTLVTINAKCTASPNLKPRFTVYNINKSKNVLDGRVPSRKFNRRVKNYLVKCVIYIQHVYRKDFGLIVITLRRRLSLSNSFYSSKL